MKEKLYISIEGNIGAGKTTILESISNLFYCIKEPVHLYTKFKSFNPLQIVYDGIGGSSAIACCQMHINTSGAFLLLFKIFGR